MNPKNELLQHHQAELKHCKRCSKMQGPVIVGNPVDSPILLIGQAPGAKEAILHKPFAWTAGKTLFKWFSQIGLDEDSFRKCVYMAAVCRCFPGKHPNGGDRVPDKQEISNCSQWLDTELKILHPELVIPVGKLAISQFICVDKLVSVIGKKHSLYIHEVSVDVIPLPHPSGASVWHRMEPGAALLQKALRKIKNHSAWKRIQNT